MKYITILCELSNDRAKVGKKTYWLTKDSHINAKGFALLEKTWQGSYNLLRFQDLDSMSLSSDFSLIEESERGENENLQYTEPTFPPKSKSKRFSNRFRYL